MRKSHYMLFAVGIATVGYVASAPGHAVPPMADDSSAAIAGQAPEPDGPDFDKEAEIANWPADMQTAYAAWPDETKSYYWTLTPIRQKMFWALTDSDKIALTAMTGPEREAAWAEIEVRAGEPPSEG